MHNYLLLTLTHTFDEPKIVHLPQEFLSSYNLIPSEFWNMLSPSYMELNRYCFVWHKLFKSHWYKWAFNFQLSITFSLNIICFPSASIHFVLEVTHIKCIYAAFVFLFYLILPLRADTVPISFFCPVYSLRQNKEKSNIEYLNTWASMFFIIACIL